MKKKLSTCIIFLLSLLGIFFLYSPKVSTLAYDNNTLRLVVDSKEISGLPKRFRKTTDKINTENGKTPNLSGLNTLNASGSSQFSEDNLKTIKQSIGNNTPITVVDLRQESHGIVNGIPVSWLGLKNKANKGLTKDQVLADENNRLHCIALGKPLTLENNHTQTIIPKKVETEEQLVKDQGMSYIRIPVTDTEKPTDDMVDYFVQFARLVPQNTWLHFHCKHGIGRTTTFMVMYDMMKNAKEVSLEDILNRQVLLGGKQLIKDDSEDAKIEGNGTQRSNLLKDFYKYCNQNNDNFKTTWSQWLKNNGISSTQN